MWRMLKQRRDRSDQSLGDLARETRLGNSRPTMLRQVFKPCFDVPDFRHGVAQLHYLLVEEEAACP